MSVFTQIAAPKLNLLLFILSPVHAHNSISIISHTCIILLMIVGVLTNSI